MTNATTTMLLTKFAKVEVMRFVRKDLIWRAPVVEQIMPSGTYFFTLNFNRQFNHIQSGSLHTAHPQKQSSHCRHASRQAFCP
jgi:hypothetical protein